ncbi:hypothetical protein FA15DRAFT_661587 [Coprinopsis marcescibilis]|uniref:Uncharacterized protein n=1 Tax=Coprinopsis marcescibilis TaxID=230819 RepID=A0A5C3KBM8_COPMA|nr:hypothetical protein FA15DRAFT_661587 [Coprinopsis marcescibilis]
MAAWSLHGCCTAIAWMLYGHCMAAVQWPHGACTAAVQWPHGDCTAAAQTWHGACTALARRPHGHARPWHGHGMAAAWTCGPVLSVEFGQTIAGALAPPAPSTTNNLTTTPLRCMSAIETLCSKDWMTMQDTIKITELFCKDKTAWEAYLSFSKAGKEAVTWLVAQVFGMGNSQPEVHGC